MRLTYLLLAVAAFAGGLTGCSDDKPPVLAPARPAVAANPPTRQPAMAKPATRFGDGKYEVGTDIVPGRYKTGGPDNTATEKCYWARLKDFSGSIRSHHAMGYANRGPDVVVIEPSDKGFETRYCGVWTLVGE